MSTKRFTTGSRCAREAGFTIAEILVALAIVGILANIAIPLFQDHIYRGRAAKVIEDFLAVRTAACQFYADKGRFPQDADAGQEPPELAPYLKGKVQWTQSSGIVYDWESLEIPSGASTALFRAPGFTCPAPRALASNAPLPLARDSGGGAPSVAGFTESLFVTDAWAASAAAKATPTPDHDPGPSENSQADAHSQADQHSQADDHSQADAHAKDGKNSDSATGSPTPTPTLTPTATPTPTPAPTSASQVASGATLVGLTVTVTDARLISTITKVYRGTLYYTLDSSTSFAIEPPQ